jgi:diacylglycerol O-acyltransferase / wax synthase
MDDLETYVGQSDAFTVSLERDPLLRSTIVAIATFDKAPDWETLVQRIDRATRLVPTFRQTLTPSPLGIAPPRWTVDPDFDLAFHLRRIQAPPPKTLEAVMEIARTEGMEAFDPVRPLWQLTLVEEMTEGRAAIIMKVHHALTDGIGGVQIIAHIVDLEEGPVEISEMPPAPTARARKPFSAWRDAISHDLGHVAGLVKNQVKSLPKNATKAAKDPLGTAADTVTTGTAIARFVRPVTSTKSNLMTGRRLQWQFTALEVELDALKAGAKKAEGTLNDGFIGAIAGGLHRYHLIHDSPVDALRLTMPISLRTEDDAEGGNHITLVRFEVPLNIEDPIERMQAIGAKCTELRKDPALPWSETVAGVLNLLPISITAGMLKNVDFLASNVPGFGLPVYAAGALLTGFFPFGPTMGSAANITLMSYRNSCCIGVNTDAGAVPDPEVLTQCLVDGFEEILDLGGSHKPVAIVKE